MHNYLTCNKNLNDCSWCTGKAKKISLKYGFDIQEVDYAVRFAENPILTQNYHEQNPEDKIKAELAEYLGKCYLTLVEDCIQIIKKIRKASKDVIKYWHELGTRILKNDSYKMNKWGSGVFIKRLAEDISVNKSTIYYAVRFAKSFPDLEKCLTDQKFSPLTWSYIVHNLLYEPKPKPSVTSKPSVPDAELEKPEFDVTDELLRIVDKTRKQPVTRVYFTGESWELRLEILHYNTKKEIELCQKVGSH